MNYLTAALPLTAGFIIDCILGDPYSLPHPVRLIGKMINFLEKTAHKYLSKKLSFGGAVIVFTVLLVTTAVPAVLLALCYKSDLWLGIAVESVMCYYLIAARCLRNESMKVYRAINENNIEKARKAVSMIVGRDTQPLDREGIIRAAVETVAENTSDGVTAPMLFIMLGGAPLGFLYKSANTMDSMIGYKNEKYRELGLFAARLDDVFNFLPSRFSAIIMILSAGLLRLDMKNAAKIWRRDRRKHESPNSAQTESVCAGALNIRLAGDAYYFGELHKKEYIGDNNRPIENEDIRRANRLMYCTSVIMFIICTAVRAFILGGLT